MSDDDRDVAYESALQYRLQRLEKDLACLRVEVAKLAQRLDAIKTLLISTLAAIVLQLLATLMNRVLFPPH